MTPIIELSYKLFPSSEVRGWENLQNHALCYGPILPFAHSQSVSRRRLSQIIGEGLRGQQQQQQQPKDYISGKPSFCTSLLQLCLYRARREWGYVQGGQLGFMRFMPEKDLVASIGAEYITIATLNIQGEKKGLQILLSYIQAGPGRKAKHGQHGQE